jgi:hypothetical protein
MPRWLPKVRRTQPELAQPDRSEIDAARLDRILDRTQSGSPDRSESLQTDRDKPQVSGKV